MSGGSDIGSHIKGVVHALSGVRMNFKPEMRKMLEKYGNMPIKEMYVCRRPLRSQLKKIVDTVNKYTGFNSVSHDTLFHLFFIFVMMDGANLVLEKNEDLNFVGYVPSNLDEKIKIDLNKSHKIDITISVLIYNAIAVYGEKRIFEYNAFSTNCQRFVIDVLYANKIMISDKDFDFIMQDVKNLVPVWANKLTHHITSFYNRIKLAVHGYGAGDATNIHFCPACQKEFSNIVSHLNSNDHYIKIFGL